MIVNAINDHHTEREQCELRSEGRERCQLIALVGGEGQLTPVFPSKGILDRAGGVLILKRVSTARRSAGIGKKEMPKKCMVDSRFPLMSPCKDPDFLASGLILQRLRHEIGRSPGKHGRSRFLHSGV